MRPAKKIKLLLFDANIVLKLHELGLLGKIVDACEVTLASSVVEESQFVDRDGVKDYIELETLIQSKAINVVTVSIAEIQAFRVRFKTTYFQKLDPGEAESLAYLFKSTDEYRIVSADTIVWKVLGATSRREQGLSLEELLAMTGLNARLDPQYSKKTRDRGTDEGFRDGQAGSALK